MMSRAAQTHLAGRVFETPGLDRPRSALLIDYVLFSRSSDSAVARCSNKRSLTDIQDSFPMSWRSMMSPHGIVRILIIMTMEVSPLSFLPGQQICTFIISVF